MTAVIDYGMGNLFSVKNALDYIGAQAEITRDPARLRSADSLILPGVGAFPDAMRELGRAGLTDVIKEEAGRKPLLGICLGMQMLFEKSYEFTECEGLGLIPGKVDRLRAPGLKIPHMGWNSLKKTAECPLLSGVPEGCYVYFVHSYMAYTQPEYIAAVADYGGDVTALVQRGNVFGSQFHPEKSGAPGLEMLRNFVSVAE
jgi:glutamine amidotransferase